ncbi:MAG TPA: Crp/Fnr family transcriptional regulator [Methanocella sp.]|nr:Crp/Fnr family transcriptional regulator [Methanocella sp.]
MDDDADDGAAGARMTVLDRKSEITRFQILVKVAAGQPQVKQSQIAGSLGITPQAVSEYVKGLAAEGMIRSGGRGQYTVTPLGVEAIIEGARELKEYSEYVLNNVVGQVAVWAALAREPVAKGSTVFLTMEDGVLYAGKGGSGAGAGARGTAINDAGEGEDVGVAGLTGLIPLRRASITVLKVPAIASGGSHAVDAGALRAAVAGIVGAAGAEALAALQKAGVEPDALFGAVEALVEAAVKGVAGTLVVSDDLAPQAVQRIEAAGVEYRTVDLASRK